jgi:hypothetical protein
MIIRHKLPHLISQIIISCVQANCKQHTQLLPDIRNERDDAARAQGNAAVPNAYTIACRGVSEEGQTRTIRQISVVYARQISGCVCAHTMQHGFDGGLHVSPVV